MADRYALVIEIDAQSLPLLASAGSRVVLGKQSLTGRPNVAWLAWDPRPSTLVLWNETYGIYAAYGAPVAGTILRLAAEVYPTLDRSVYAFRGGTFSLPVSDERVPPRHYDVRNESNLAATFGLIQTASIDGAALRGPINASVVPTNSGADFTPLTMLRIWLQRSVSNGTIVTAPQNACVVQYDAQRHTVRVRYDHQDGRFHSAAP